MQSTIFCLPCDSTYRHSAYKKRKFNQCTWDDEYWLSSPKVSIPKSSLCRALQQYVSHDTKKWNKLRFFLLGHLSSSSISTVMLAHLNITVTSIILYPFSEQPVLCATWNRTLDHNLNKTKLVSSILWQAYFSWLDWVDLFFIKPYSYRWPLGKSERDFRLKVERTIPAPLHYT